MKVHGCVFVRKGTWPRRVLINVFLNEDSRTGRPLSGKVKLFIRKGDNARTSRNLGDNGQELVVDVVNGRWQNQKPWNYKYWADLGFDTLVAQYTDNDGLTHEWFWNPLSSSSKEAGNKEIPVPTSISEIHHTCAVDVRNPENMQYALTWTILDQFGKPIAGTVTSMFDGTQTEVESKPDRIGVCFDKVLVEGYGVERFYTVLPPTGQPKIIKLLGPTKSVEKTPEPKVLEVLLVRTTFADSKATHHLFLLAKDQDNKPINVGKALWSLGEGKAGGQVDLSSGSALFDVEISEAETSYPLTAVAPDATLALARPFILEGPPKKEDEGPKVADAERFKLGVEGEVIKARAFRAVIPYQTFDKHGKAYISKVEATMVEGGNATFINARTNAVLAEKACYCETTTDPDGSYRLQVEFKGRMRITVELFHPESNQRRKIELVYSQY